MKPKKTIVIYGVLLVIAVFLMVLLYNVSNRAEITLPRDFPEIIKSGKLNIVTDYNPVGYRVSGDSISGFQYELIKALERDWKLKANIFLENSLDENLQGLEQGKYDIVARNIPV
ncbi:MAG: transporter substrate-binding domain-containing protein, partial [Petrimonas sp.]|nr:transporter substrate-binding domain-containing protein [Petrimonas sp.]MEA5044482.1 transporter substrate-binding domain-containing protein [Petrimonas sp.]MEA5062550.1 transporter substrate-binding domain-containing protein [Petrimonas sp.]